MKPKKKQQQLKENINQDTSKIFIHTIRKTYQRHRKRIYKENDQRSKR